MAPGRSPLCSRRTSHMRCWSPSSRMMFPDVWSQSSGTRISTRAPWVPCGVGGLGATVAGGRRGSPSRLVRVARAPGGARDGGRWFAAERAGGGCRGRGLPSSQRKWKASGDARYLWRRRWPSRPGSQRRTGCAGTSSAHVRRTFSSYAPAKEVTAVPRARSRTDISHRQSRHVRLDF